MREQKLRDTNESTNERVKWFSLGTMGVLVSLGGWQVVYLRAYFRYVLWCAFSCRASRVKDLGAAPLRGGDCRWVFFVGGGLLLCQRPAKHANRWWLYRSKHLI
jgi:hypothetical protein